MHISHIQDEFINHLKTRNWYTTKIRWINIPRKYSEFIYHIIMINPYIVQIWWIHIPHKSTEFSMMLRALFFFFLLFFFDNDKTRKQFKPAETNQNHLCQLRKTTKKTTHFFVSFNIQVLLKPPSATSKLSKTPCFSCLRPPEIYMTFVSLTLYSLFVHEKVIYT